MNGMSLRTSSVEATYICGVYVNLILRAMYYFERSHFNVRNIAFWRLGVAPGPSPLRHHGPYNRDSSSPSSENLVASTSLNLRSLV
jgi:hypothetical protein